MGKLKAVPIKWNKIFELGPELVHAWMKHLEGRLVEADRRSELHIGGDDFHDKVNTSGSIWQSYGFHIKTIDAIKREKGDGRPVWKARNNGQSSTKSPA